MQPLLEVKSLHTSFFTESGEIRAVDGVSFSIAAEEAFGLVVTEALARNLKFFGSRLGGIIDIAQDAPGAELFAKDDWPGLTAAIAQWIGHGSPKTNGADALMRERYHPTVIARRHVEIYREVLKTLPQTS